jgi:hypothetical protein
MLRLSNLNIAVLKQDLLLPLLLPTFKCNQNRLFLPDMAASKAQAVAATSGVRTAMVEREELCFARSGDVVFMRRA